MPMPVPTETNAKLSTSRPCPWALLGQRGGVDVVLDHQRSAEGVAQLGQHGRLVPPGQGAGQGQRVALRVVDARAAEHGLGDGAGPHAGLGVEHVGQPAQLGDQARSGRRP